MDQYLDDWKNGTNNIKRQIKDNIDYIFGSEIGYSEMFNILYPDSKYIILDSDRKKFPISSTDIRRDGAFRHWNYIPNICKQYYNKKVVIVGTESTGKSTMVKKLALYYNTEYVEEFGRVMCEKLKTGQPTEEYYPYIVYGQKMLEFERIQTANKILFIDTESTVTQFYSELYADKNFKLLDEISKLHEYDLIIYLSNDVKWVDDGLRIHNSKEERKKNDLRLKFLLNANKLNYRIVNDKNYNSRFKSILKIVDNLIYTENSL